MTTELQTSEPRSIPTRLRNGVTDWFHQNTLAMVTLVLLLAAWEVYATFDGRPNSYFPTIEFVIEQTIVFQSQVQNGIAVTATEVIIGWLASVVFGIVIGIVLAESSTIRQMMMPGLIFLYSLPHAIMAPVFILWFGFGLFGIGLFVAWYGFFPVLVGTITGFSHVDRQFENLGEVTGATRWQMIKKIKFWVALPHIISSTKIAVQFSIVGAIIAEFLISTGGLGRLVVQASQLSRTGLLFGVLIVLMVFAIVFYKIVALAIDIVTPASI